MIVSHGGTEARITGQFDNASADDFVKRVNGSAIQEELDNRIYAAGNPGITSNPKPAGWGARPHRWLKNVCFRSELNSPAFVTIWLS